MATESENWDALTPEEIEEKKQTQEEDDKVLDRLAVKLMDLFDKCSDLANAEGEDSQKERAKECLMASKEIRDFLTANEAEPIYAYAAKNYVNLRDVVVSLIRQVTVEKADTTRILSFIEGVIGDLIGGSREVMINKQYPKEKRIPVLCITGFLGSGKTTLLNYILAGDHGKRIAVIENEFGEVGIDDKLVKRRLASEEEIFEMNNGCICCTVRGDLIRILKKLSEQKNKFDYIIIETTGLADPGPIAQTFFVDVQLGWEFRLDGIITVVDSKHLIQHLDDEKPPEVENEAVEQIAFADVILLNKTDLVSAEELEGVKQRIQSINKTAPLIPTHYSSVPLDKILDQRAFDLERVLEMDPEFLLDNEHQHDLTVTSVGIELEGEVNSQKLNAWLGNFLQTKGADIFRMKGVEEKFVFHGVHMIFDGNPMAKWEPQEKRVNRMVFIGRNLNRQEIVEKFKACLA